MKIVVDLYDYIEGEDPFRVFGGSGSVGGELRFRFEHGEVVADALEKAAGEIRETVRGRNLLGERRKRG